MCTGACACLPAAGREKAAKQHDEYKSSSEHQIQADTTQHQNDLLLDCNMSGQHIKAALIAMASWRLFLATLLLLPCHACCNNATMPPNADQQNMPCQPCSSSLTRCNAALPVRTSAHNGALHPIHIHRLGQEVELQECAVITAQLPCNLTEEAKAEVARQNVGHSTRFDGEGCCTPMEAGWSNSTPLHRHAQVCSDLLQREIGTREVLQDSQDAASWDLFSMTMNRSGIKYVVECASRHLAHLLGECAGCSLLCTVWAFIISCTNDHAPAVACG